MSLAQTILFQCDGVSPAPVAAGVDTIDLAFYASPVADIIAESATASGDGIVNVPLSGSGRGAFALATDNVGVTGTLTVSADTGAATLPLALTLCPTNPVTGQCLSTPATSATLAFGGGATATFSIFVNATGAVAFDPANSRVFVRFKDSGGAPHGSTSVAVRTQ
jgi:hypothetical protein